MRDLVIQLHAGENQDFVAAMVDQGLERIVLGARGRRFMSKPALLWQYFRGGIGMIRRRRDLRTAGTVIVSGHFGYVLKLFARFGLLKYRRSLCFAFFVHSPRWFTAVRWLSRLDTADDHYVIFSRSEVALYARSLGIETRRMHYLPYGEWGQVAALPGALPEVVAGDYYFSGGYSNRDYLVLIEVFRKLSARLVIVASRLNRELERVVLPSNVSVFYDLPRAVFEAYARGAKAGIVSLKHDTGASGQSVVLILMRLGKCIIANDAGAVRDYIEPGISGLLLRNLTVELPDVIACLEHDSRLAGTLGAAARARYENSYSPGAVARAFQELLTAA